MLRNLFSNKKDKDDDGNNVYILNISDNACFMEYYLYPITTGCLDYDDILIDILTTLLNKLFVIMDITKRPINEEVDFIFSDVLKNNFSYDKNIIGEKNKIHVLSVGLNKEVLYYMFEKEIYNSDIKIYAKYEQYVDLSDFTGDYLNDISNIIIEIGKNEEYIKIREKKNSNSNLDELYIARILKKYAKKLEIEDKC